MSGHANRFGKVSLFLPAPAGTWVELRRELLCLYRLRILHEARENPRLVHADPPILLRLLDTKQPR